MADFGIGEIGIPAILSALGAVGGATTAGIGLANAARSQPKPPSIAPQDPTQMPRALLPQVRADAAARTGGGLSPEFLASLVDQSTGQPGGGMDILKDIRVSLGQGP